MWMYWQQQQAVIQVSSDMDVQTLLQAIHNWLPCSQGSESGVAPGSCCEAGRHQGLSGAAQARGTLLVSGNNNHLHSQ